MLGKKKLHQMVDTKSPSTFKCLKIDATRNFPENCGSFICQNNGIREINLECPSTTNPVIVETTRNFPENFDPFVRENNETREINPPSNTRPRNGSDTQGSVDAESKSCFEASGARPKETGGSSHLNTSCRPTNGNQPLKLKEENLMYEVQKPSTDTRNTCDWFIKDEPIENGPELPANVSQENPIEARNEPSKKTSQRVHHEDVSDDESRSWVDDDDLSILTCSEWNILRSTLKALKLFDAVYTKLLREDKAEKPEGRSKRNIHIEAAMTMKNQKKWVNCEWTFGHVPGVEIGDQFRFRAELVTIGLHHQVMNGINYVNIGRKYVATSIVDSGRCDNEAISSETFIYVGQGGNPKVSVNARVEDQKLKGGNLALKNSMDMGCPVRVICGRQRVNGEKSDMRYIYDGLYTVTKCWEEIAPTGKYVFKFELKRNLGQPKLNREIVSRPTSLVKVDHFHVNKETKSIMQSEFVVDYDVLQGKEKIPIRVVNAIDDERLPSFTYITNIQYPDWYYISRPQGCNCTSGCLDSEQCSCTSRNGGEIPFNTRGSIVRAQPLVYECGPSCKCPPTCKNRISQHGPRDHLEVFKTESRGWGLRSRDHVSSGSFICEYVGELLDEMEAESRIDNDEYLFDVGNYDEEIPKRNPMRNNNLKVESDSLRRKDEDGFTLDAVRYGNVGRFINYSCSPNLYAQNVMYYHGDRRVPHIMFFASKSIAPLEEFTYHYNYDHVCDKNRNLKRKNCRCGSRKCEARMY
ncbi:hypothetical protein KY290_017726 [Solanum tuberosum]|uniref:SET domain protein n=2 Tax=Solanum tuberosum TaxID=4113 RepID=A0ABQ7VCY9_SOLTU|nr:hypothetical protein KY290_017726 [Solanum tuberosum]